MTGGIDDVDQNATLRGTFTVVANGGVLCEDRDALLALEIHRVHHAVFNRAFIGLVSGEGARLPQHGIDERGLAVVNVGDDRNVAHV